MALSRLKALASSPAVRRFTDRDDARAAFGKALAAYLSGASPFRVLAYYGVGGIGKTSLLTQLGLMAQDEAKAAATPLCMVRLDFDSDHLTSAAEAQYAFRRQWPGDCHVFEFALARYWVAQGRSLEQIRKQVIREDSLLFDLIEESAGLADLFVPVKLIAKLLGRGSELAHRYGKHRAEFERIAALPEAQLAQQLPVLLGMAIEDWCRKGNRLLVLVDGHERLFADERYKLGKMHGDDWLRELVGAAENGLYVLCGRNYVKWAESNPEWTEFLEQHVLGRLSNEDAAEFLRGIPVTEAEIRRKIVAEARGVPLYLDICASIYIVRKAAGEPIREEDFGNADGEVVNRFMDCLDREQAQAVRALSVLECFDRKTFLAVTSALNIAISAGLFDEFCAASYVEYLDVDRRVAKIHNIIRERLQPQVPREHRLLIVQALLERAQACRLEGEFAGVAMVMRSMLPCVLWPSLGLNASCWTAFAILCLELADAGYVDETAALAASLESGSAGDARMIGCAIAAHCLRRKGELEKSKLHYARSGALDAGPGYEALRLRVGYQAAHVDHLLGQYAEAEHRYRRIAAAVPRDDIEASTHWIAKRQLADIRMLQGRFPEALGLFEECLQAPSGTMLWRLECERFLGHVQRFNWDVEGAVTRYGRIAAEAGRQGWRALQGKALGNIAEACAWDDPARAIEAAAQAIEIAEACNNPIEAGKSRTALGIARLVSGRLREAEAEVDAARRIQEACGYRSGVMFATGASACLRLAAGDAEGMRSELAAMASICDAIGVYHYLPWFHRRACGEREPAAAGEVAQWLDVASVEAAIQRVNKAIGAAR